MNYRLIFFVLVVVAQPKVPQRHSQPRCSDSVEEHRDPRYRQSTSLQDVPHRTGALFVTGHAKYRSLESAI